MLPVVNGFLLSGLLIAVDVAFLGSGDLVVVGIFTSLLSLALLFIVRSENQNLVEKSIPDWRDIKSDEAENQRVEEQIKRSLDVEVGHSDLALIKKRLRQSSVLFLALCVIAVPVIVWIISQKDFKIFHLVMIGLVPYAVWAAFWGGVSVLGRGPSIFDPSTSELSDDPIENMMGCRQMRGAEVLLWIAALFYGILGAGIIEYRRHQGLS